MSLIADALKRAQEQRAKGKDGKDDDDRARRMLTSSGPLRVETRDGSRVPPSVAVAGTVLAAALITFGGVVWLAPAAGEGDGEAEAVALSNASGGVEGPRTASSGSVEQGPGSSEGAGERPPPSEPAEQRPPSSEPVGQRLTALEDVGLRQSPSEGAAGRQPPPEPVERPRTTSEPPGGEETSFTLRVAGQQATAPMAASELFGRALSAQQRGDLRGAAALYRRAIERNPRDAQLHNNLGTVYRALSMPGEALSAFRTAVDVDPSYAPAWSNLGIMLDGLGRHEEAVAAFREALRRDPSNTGARVNLANKYIGMEMVDEARAMLREVLRDVPTLPEAHYAMGRALEAADETAEAVRHYRVFLDLADGQFPGLEQRVRTHLGELEGGGR